MKKIILTAVLLTSCLMFKADAQLRINLGFNIGSQPEWGPVGYNHAEYYYMPDIDAYYDVPNHQYIYYQNNVWVHGALPARYHFDPYHSYKVVVNQRNPWEHHDVIRARYAGFRGRQDQQIIRESRDQRYRNHWQGDRGQYGHDDHRGDRGHDNRGHDDHGHDDHGHDH